MILMESDQCCAPSQHYDQNAKTIFDSRDLQQLTFPTYFPAVASLYFTTYFSPEEFWLAADMD